jgi:hypothetical protein
MHPTDANILYIATNHGVWKTTNALSTCTWSRVLGSDNEVYRGLAFKPGTPTTVYASGTDIKKSTNSGSSWSSLTGTGTGLDFSLTPFNDKYIELINIDVTAANNSLLYATIVAVENDGSPPFHYFYKYNGSSWTQKTSLSGENTYTGTRLAIECSDADENAVYIGQERVFRTLDGGANWTALISYYGGIVHPDVHDIKFSPDGTILYAATDGGLYKTTNPTYTGGYPTWTTLNTGLQLGLVYKLGASATNSDLIMIGELDCGSNLYNNTGSPSQPWTIAFWADGMETLIDRNDEDEMYCSTNGANANRINKTTSQWVSGSSTFTGPSDESSDWVFPIIQNENNNMIYVGYKDIYKTVTSSPSWTRLSNFFGEFSTGLYAYLKTVSISNLNPNYIYTATRTAGGTYSPHLFKTIIGGGYGAGCLSPNPPCWEEMSPPDIAEITGIAIHPDYPEKIWITYSGYTTDKVKYYDGSSWSSYSTGLPAMPINCIVYEKGSADGLYVGTDVGVYFRNKNMSAWEKYNESLPNVIINELEINYGINKIRAATFGRGVWQSSLACPTNYDITLSGAHSFNYFYEAENNINSTGTIASGRVITYRAGNEVALTDGFAVASGGEFGAFIHPCDHPGNSFNKTDETEENNVLRLSQLQSEKTETDNKILVFPNPNKGQFTLSIGERLTEIQAILIIRDITGREVSQANISKSQTILDLTEQRAGIYFLELSYPDGRTERVKVVKE